MRRRLRCFGTASLNRIGRYAGAVCNIDLGNISAEFAEICCTANPSSFLDELTQAYLKYVEISRSKKYDKNERGRNHKR